LASPGIPVLIDLTLADGQTGEQFARRQPGTPAVILSGA